ncbi:hypothetical protein AB0M50_50475, partial [Nonomuraea fuscirosea]|uniref:hypothetical protein n=1 Tax=Nonomuraea fuscirosea TaxID=1291556 RepID=UPI003419F1E2
MSGQGFGVVRPLPGNGLVAYVGGLLLVCDSAESAADDLLEALREDAPPLPRPAPGIPGRPGRLHAAARAGPRDHPR